MSTYVMQGRKMGKIKAKLFCLCALSVRRMTVYFVGLWLAIQGVFVSVETLFWGETFSHAGDSIVTMLISVAYFYYTHAMGDFLLDLTLNAERVEHEAGQ